LNRRGVVYTEINGERHSTGLVWHEKNKKLALQVLEQRIREYLVPTPVVTQEQQPMTVADGLKEFARVHFKNVEKDTVRIIKNSFVALLPTTDHLLTDTEGIRTEVFQHLETTTLHINTQHKYLSWLRQFFDFCIDEGYCTNNPVKRSMMPKRLPSDIPPFSDEEFTRILQHFEQSSLDRREYILLLRFLRLTAVRIREALTVRMRDVTATYIVIHGKGRRERKIPLAPFPQVQALVEEIRTFRGADAEKLFSWTAYAKLEKWLRDALKELGIDGNRRNFHSIRKLRENEMIIKERLPIDVVCQILGHTRAIQERHYLRLMSVEEMSAIIRGKK
jgi:integrase